jgi:orotate phosphoribosyltransferase
MNIDPGLLTLQLVNIALCISGLLAVCEILGFLPRRFSAWLTKNRLSQTLEVLKELGIDPDSQRRKNISANTPHFPQTNHLQDQVKLALKSFTLDHSVVVGRTQRVNIPQFIDLMGGTTEPNTALSFARFLCNEWRYAVEQGRAQQIDFDFVAAPKNGSPILAYEFARLMQRPLVLCQSTRRYEGPIGSLREYVDTSFEIQRGQRALMVDDSTTGGTKILEAVDILRKGGVIVKDCLVVFEPSAKSARARLADNQVSLHAILKVGG